MKNAANSTQYFYQNNKLITVKSGAQSRTIFRTADQPLAEQSGDGSSNGLLATDDKGSVLQVEGSDDD
ncbi:hypothetical protein [Pseudomonas putida]